MSVFAPRCPSCDARRSVARFPVARHRLRLAVRVLAVLTVLALIALFVHRRRRGNPADVALREQAVEAIDRGESERAAVLLEEHLRDSPDDAHAWQLLAVAAKRAGRPADVYRAHAHRALELKPRLRPALHFLAQSHFEEGEWDDAVRLGLRAAETRPETAEPWILVAEAELRRAAPSRALAVRALRRARGLGGPDLLLRARAAAVQVEMLGDTPADALPPDLQLELADVEAALLADSNSERPEVPPEPAAWLGAEILTAIGRNHLAKRRLDELTTMLGERISSFDRTRILLLRARIASAEENPGEAIAHYGAALQADSGGLAARALVEHARSAVGADSDERIALLRTAADSSPSTCAALATELVNRGELAEAERRLDAAAAGGAGAAAPPAERAALAAARGLLLRARGDLVDARQHLTRASELAPDPVPALVLRALCAVDEPAEARAAATADAERELLDLLDEERPREDVLAALGRVRAMRGDVGGAREALGRACDIAPWDPHARVLLAQIELRASDGTAATRAARAASRAFDMRPYDPAVAVPALDVLLAAGSDNDAAWRAQRYLDRRPDDVRVLRIAAVAAVRHGRDEHAALLLEAAARLTPDDPLLLAELVDVLNTVGRRDDAAEVVRDAVARLGEDGARPASIAHAIHAMGRGAAATVAAGAAEGPLGQAVALLVEDRVDEALGVLSERLRHDPTDRDALRLLVLTATSGTPERTRIERAEQALATTVLAGDDPFGRLLRGAVSLARGDVAAARNALDAAAATMPRDADAQFLAGEAALRDGDLSAARARFRSALVRPAARWTLGRAIAARLVAAAREEQDDDIALALLNEAAAAAPHDENVVHAQALALRERGRHAEAADVLERRLRRGGLDREGQRELRVLALEARMATGNLVSVVEHLEELGRGDESDEVAALVLRGVVQMRAGDVAAAAPLLQRAHEQAPDDATAALALIEALVRLNRNAEARDVADAWTRDRPDRARLGFTLTRAFARRGALDDARAQAESVLDERPGDPLALRQLVWVEALRGAPEEALARLDDEIERRGADSAEAALPRLLRAELLTQRLGRHKEAERAARAFLVRDDVDDAVLRRAALVAAEARLAQGDTVAAAAMTQSLRPAFAPGTVQRESESDMLPRLRFVEGVVAYTDGNKQAAETAFRACLSADPSHAGAANNLAWLLAVDLERPQDAVPPAEVATRVAPDVADHWDTLGVALHGDRRPAEALAAFDRAIALFETAGQDESLAQSLVHRARAHLDAGDEDACRRDAARARHLTDSPALRIEIASLLR